jgi:glucose uptake protein GlcU
MLLLTAEIGTGKGFAISQMGTVFNAVLGIFWLKDPPIRTRAAGLTFTGVALATLGGILLGSVR